MNEAGMDPPTPRIERKLKQSPQGQGGKNLFFVIFCDNFNNVARPLKVTHGCLSMFTGLFYLFQLFFVARAAKYAERVKNGPWNF